ncbi:MAG: GMC family oxidoreductase [Acidobacteriota bacterium]
MTAERAPYAIHEASHDRPPDGVFTRRDIARETELSCDVVVVGSGAGGSTAAAELAEAGFDVIVLEEGSFHGTPDFSARALAMIRKLYRDGGATAALGKPPILYQEGCTVGGSAVINGGMSWRTPERILDDWATRHGLPGLRPKLLAPYFDRVERRAHVAYQDPESIGRDNQLLKDGADKLGWAVDRNLRNQLHCAGSNNCAFGCPTGAKQSPLATYVPRALRFGARIYANVKVERIVFRGTRARGVLGFVGAENGSRGPSVSVAAKLVMVACGSIHTPALLRRSGFRAPSGQLGRNLSMHPNLKVIALFDEEVRGWEGVHQAFQVRELADRGVHTLAAVNVPPSIVAMGTPQIGAELGGLMAEYPKAVIAGLLCEDTNTGRVRTIAGRPVAFYDLSEKDFANMREGAAALCQLLLEVGARRILLPFPELPEIRSADDVAKIRAARLARQHVEVLTVHMMGTARMGTEEAGVTDSFGRVHGAEGLVVCDASLFPTAVAVNPCETIQTLSTRCAARVIENPPR